MEAGTSPRPARRCVSVREELGEYRVDLDVSEFRHDELRVDVLGRRITVRGVQSDTGGGETPFRVRETLEESFRLPDDADPDRVQAVYRHGTLAISTRRGPLRRRDVPVEQESLVGATPMGC